jgi:hypothetical protein
LLPPHQQKLNGSFFDGVMKKRRHHHQQREKQQQQRAIIEPQKTIKNEQATANVYKW